MGSSEQGCVFGCRTCSSNKVQGTWGLGVEGKCFPGFVFTRVEENYSTAGAAATPLKGHVCLQPKLCRCKKKKKKKRNE